MARTYGHIDGVEIGDVFQDRKALAKAGIHSPLVQGIWGGKDGAESIVLNEGYIDDEDFGDQIIYTGHGGNEGKRQVADQEFHIGNLGLAVSCIKGYPVRVSRGPKLKSPYGCKDGYRYDGLYRVEDYWQEVGKDGFKIWRYRLVIEDSITHSAEVKNALSVPKGNQNPKRSKAEVLRIVRDTKLSKSVKDLHKDTCQSCSVQLEVPSGTYSEAAHVKPLGSPHNGPDTAENIICLCPNCHVLFDRGAIWLDESHTWQPSGRPLLNDQINPLDPQNSEYHRTRFGSR